MKKKGKMPKKKRMDDDEGYDSLDYNTKLGMDFIENTLGFRRRDY